MNLFDETCFECSKLITTKYSTSFSTGINAFDKRFRYPVYAIYGFVRYADEIVDTFYDHDQRQLIDEFKEETFKAIDRGISTNPVLQSFQQVVNKYSIEKDLINAFLTSMKMDLDKTAYDDDGYKTYIYGSAEVVGLMCLRIFCEHDAALYDKLVPKARSLGSAFQKINFLRDIKSDYEDRGRTYFPEIDFTNFTESDKQLIETDIKQDFDDALEGIKLLPSGSRLGVYVAYIYYLQLFKKIKATTALTIMQKRIRVSDTQKLSLYLKAKLHQKLNII
ncbi:MULTISPECIES: phytoene/squalene synthase family protein [unclassified Mucilaginibacter]|uniref:phytoene/squalene synthase family protein n=1 Tax=unclassified Mucilaginibacter TaxID=2617802 RepID=UPI002AC8F5FA|nr:MULTISPECIES: phytoene/squalene synthase family protein [unclassified Mucilaginibacter]MEB0263073.1 phytoene/squalene synthase family protein [Mucilaginibacter sp. 10I4]MEB0277516.1 phytoene/squalene synthase family protein [Mucilaginibacter sp. 10B2]MEB0299431.1 phytoene/squalene synthase family protein [Mucilaginibacter sp. 5C4]WPX24854.1 phytoene/squalene synthase family protein [Mucilaginibacter sp. 5C4]